MFAEFLNETAYLISLIAFLSGFLLYIGSKIIKWIPVLTSYKALFEYSGIALIIGGSYFFGVTKTEKEYIQKMKEADARVAIAEEKARIATGKIEYVFIDRVKKVKDTQIVIQEKIRDISVKIDDKCIVDPSAIEILNAAAANRKPVIEEGKSK